MPTLKWFPPQGSPPRVPLYKPVSSVGRVRSENDIALPQAGNGLGETHVQILFDGRDFNLEEVDKHAEILINGKKKRRARLVHGDRLTLGDTELQFSMFDEPASTRVVATPSGNDRPSSELHRTATLQQIAGVRKLYEFSEKLMTMKKLDELLEAMLDTVIDVTGAGEGADPPARGGGRRGPNGEAAAPSKPVVRAARNVESGKRSRTRPARSATASSAACSRRGGRSSSATPSPTPSSGRARASSRCARRA